MHYHSMPAAFVVVVIFVMITNALWYRVKFILRGRGYPTFFFHSHFQDFGQFRKLISAETDPVLRRRYSVLQTALYVSVAITFCGMVAFVFGMVRGVHSR